MTAPPVVPNTAPALIRTVTPLVVGTVLAWLASRGLDLTAYGNAVNVFLVPALGGIYYAAVLKAEKRWPWVGWLLLYARQPQYIDPAGQPVTPPAQPLAGGHVHRVAPYVGEHRRDPVDEADAAARRDDPPA